MNVSPRHPIPHSPVCRETFEFRRRFQLVSPALAAWGPIPPKRVGIWHAELRAEIPMAFWQALTRHLSVVFCSGAENV